MSNISIIIPVFNVGNYLSTCIDSVLNQTYIDFELLLVDDGSSDNSGLICDEYAIKDSRIRVYHKKNEGVSVARNYGIKHANAPWICFVDSDDWIEDNYLMNFFTHKIEETTMVSQGLLYDYSSSNKGYAPFFVYPDILIGDLDLPKGISAYKLLDNGCPCSKLFNKKIIEDNSIYFNPKISTHEDHIFVLTYLLYVENIILCSGVSYHYMIRERESLSTISHSSEDYMEVSKELITKMFQCKHKFFIDDKYFSSAITSMGLQQLIFAAKYVNRWNYKKIFTYIYSKKNIFSKYFISRSLSARFFLFLLFHDFPFFIIYHLIKFSQCLKMILLSGKKLVHFCI